MPYPWNLCAVSWIFGANDSDVVGTIGLSALSLTVSGPDKPTNRITERVFTLRVLSQSDEPEMPL